jgi:hypothetical protein
VSNRHAIADLLEIARATLREEVLPQVPAETRYEASMVANAMAIASRELELGPKVRAEERTLLAELYPEAPEATLAELQRRLCRDLRQGTLAPLRAAALDELLPRLVHARLTISNPGYRSGPRQSERQAT